MKAVYLILLIIFLQRKESENNLFLVKVRSVSNRQHEIAYVISHNHCR